MSVQLNLADPLLFGNDAGEDEPPEVLASYFVEHPSLAVFWDPAQRLQIARARKGMGKSALLAKLAYDLRLQGRRALSIPVTGSDLTGMGEFSSDDPAVLINQWQQVLCARVNMELGRQIGWAGSDHSIMMVESAELAGFRGRNFIGVLTDRLKGKLGPVELQKISAPNQKQLLKDYLDPDKHPTVWLLVDDVDSTFTNSAKIKNKTSAFFSACRRLVQLVEGLRIRATVRADVWSVLRDNEDLDKCEQYMVDIKWTKNEMGDILSKKILAYIQRKHTRSAIAKWNHITDQESLIELAFERRLPWRSNAAPPLQVVNIFAAKRPRWLAQLCRLSGVEATRLGKDRIDIQAINGVLEKFGKLRISDLRKEHSHQYSDIERLVECFSRGPRRYTTNELMQRVLQGYVSRIGASRLPEIDGAQETNVLRLCHFLFKIGFLQGRSNVSDNAIYIEYEDRPELLTTSVNMDDGLIWEIYPSYRNTLKIT